MTQARDRYQKSRDVWKDQVSRQEFEHDLINRKTTWGLTCQSILFAAYGVTLTGGQPPKGIVAISNEFRRVVIFSGLLIASVTLVAVLATINSKRMSWRQYGSFYDEHPLLQEPLVRKPLQWGVRTPNTIVTMIAEAFLPLIFLGAWLYLQTHSLTTAIVTIAAIAATISAIGVIIGWETRERRKSHAKPEAGQEPEHSGKRL
jgi:hypothetical protein